MNLLPRATSSSRRRQWSGSSSSPYLQRPLRPTSKGLISVVGGRNAGSIRLDRRRHRPSTAPLCLSARSSMGVLPRSPLAASPGAPNYAYDSPQAGAEPGSGPREDKGSAVFQCRSFPPGSTFHRTRPVWILMEGKEQGDDALLPPGMSSMPTSSPFLIGLGNRSTDILETARPSARRTKLMAAVVAASDEVDPRPRSRGLTVGEDN